MSKLNANDLKNIDAMLVSYSKTEGVNKSEIDGIRERIANTLEDMRL